MLGTRHQIDLYENAAHALSECSGVFLNYFQRKTVLVTTVKLTEDLLKHQDISQLPARCIKNSVLLGILMLQGSLQTSGSAFFISSMMDMIGYSETESYWAGFSTAIAVSLAVDQSPWKILTTVIATVGGLTGKHAALSMYASCKAIFQIPEKKPKEHHEEYHAEKRLTQ